MNKDDISKLRELPIEGVAEQLGLKIVGHASLCEYHNERTPSMHFSRTKNTFTCYSCKAHGGVIDLTMKVLGKNFNDACKWLSDRNNIVLKDDKQEVKPAATRPSTFTPEKYLRFFEHPFLSSAATAFLYGERRLDARVVSWCRLNSYSDRNGIPWLQIPYYDVDGKLIGVQSRNLAPSLRGKDGEKLPRFRFPYGSNCPIYNMPVLKMLRKGEPLYITEGCSDCWAMLSSGHKAIAIPSATLLKKDDKKLLSELICPLQTELHMYPDQDIPGERLFIELTQMATSIGLCLVRHRLPQGCKDYSEYFLTLNIRHSTK